MFPIHPYLCEHLKDLRALSESVSRIREQESRGGKIYYGNSVEKHLCITRQFNSSKMYIRIQLGFLLLMIV